MPSSHHHHRHHGQHRNTYARTSFRVVAENKFLRLGELEFAPVAGAALEGKSSPPAPRKWEIVQRTTRQAVLPPASKTDAGDGNEAQEQLQQQQQQGEDSPSIVPDAVDILAFFHHPKPEPGATSGGAAAPKTSLVLVSQYRPPLDAVCVEFPAGLLDAGESPAAAAVRELKEECGFVARGEVSEHKGVAGNFGGVSDVSRLLAYEPGMSDSCFNLVSVDINGALPENQQPEQEPDDEEDIAVHLIPIDYFKPEPKDDDGNDQKDTSPLAAIMGLLGGADLNPTPEQHLAALVRELGAGRTVVDGKVFTLFRGLSIGAALQRRQQQ